jgi:hypothetical protein
MQRLKQEIFSSGTVRRLANRYISSSIKKAGEMKNKKIDI